jgi:hypothetical protein
MMAIDMHRCTCTWDELESRDKCALAGQFPPRRSRIDAIPWTNDKMLTIFWSLAVCLMHFSRGEENSLGFIGKIA